MHILGISTVAFRRKNDVPGRHYRRSIQKSKRGSLHGKKDSISRLGPDENSTTRNDIAVTVTENIRPYENSVETTENN